MPRIHAGQYPALPMPDFKSPNPNREASGGRLFSQMSPSIPFWGSVEMPRTHLNKQNRKGRGRFQPESATSGTPEKRDAGHTAGKGRS